MKPPWALTGGGALVGFYTTHRSTRDLDLFWHLRHELGSIIRDVEARLQSAEFQITRIQTSASFVRLRIAAGEEITTLDLIADPVPTIEPPQLLDDGILVDTPHEVLVNKINALLSRSEVRDLEDVRVLVERGEDLHRAIRDAHQKDGGFSPLTLAWLLRQFPLFAAEDLGFDHAVLSAFRDQLIEILTTPTRT